MADKECKCKLYKCEKYKDDKLDKRAYLTLIQGVITRESNHAVTTHNWGIIGITGCIAWECNHYTTYWTCLLSLPVWLFFFALSSFFHWNERRYIALYNSVVNGTYKGEMFDISPPKPSKKEESNNGGNADKGIMRDSYLKNMFSSVAILAFWGALLAACLFGPLCIHTFFISPPVPPISSSYFSSILYLDF